MAVGWLTTERIRHPRGALTVEDGAIRTPALLRVDDPSAELLENPNFAGVGRAVVIDAAGRPLGVISVSDMERRVRAHQRPKEQ